MSTSSLFASFVFAVVGSFGVVGCLATHEGSDEPSVASEESAQKVDACAAVRCISGTHCVAKGKRAECVADAPGPCNLACIQGYHCEAGPVRCVPTLCPTGACGPSLGLANTLCSDGVSIAGPTGNCLSYANGTCGWEVLSCPL